MKEFKAQLDRIIRNPYYMFSVITIAVMSYGYSVTHTTVGIDDLEGDRYIGSGNVMIAAGRFGMEFWAKIFGNGNNDPAHSYTVDAIAVVMLILATITFCVLFNKITEDKLDIKSSIVFSVIFISYPLINEIWEYTGANLCVCGGYLLVPIIIYITHELIYNKNFSILEKVIDVVLVIFLMTLICSSYESIVAVYVLTVFIVLFLQLLYSNNDCSKANIFFRDGLIYAAVAAIGIISRVIIHKILLGLMNLGNAPNGETIITWTNEQYKEDLINLIAGIRYKYGWQSILNHSIRTYLIALIIFIVLVVALSIARKSIMILFAGVCLSVSVFSLSIIQGNATPYRTCQTFAVFVAFVFEMLYFLICEKMQKKGQVALLIIVGIIAINQATTLSCYLTLNHLRSENEAYAIRTAGTDVERKNIDKPVVMVGGYSIPSDIWEKTFATKREIKIANYLGEKLGQEPIANTRLVETNVNSAISWAMQAFRNEKDCLEQLFRYYGFTFEFEQTNYDEAVEYVSENNIPSYPQNGYIVETEDYVIVNWGL